MAPRQGTGFINWGQFVNANRGTLDRMSGELGGAVEQGGRDAERRLRELTGQFDTSTYNAMRPAAQMPNKGTGYSGIPELDAALKQREDELSAFGATTYGGPMSIADVEGFGEAAGAADRTAAQSNRMADLYGRSAELGSRYATAVRPYTGAARLFDSALLQSSPGQQRFEQGKAQYGGIGGNYRQALKDTGAAGASQARMYGDMTGAARKAAGEMGAEREFQTRQMEGWANRDNPSLSTPIPRGRTPMEELEKQKDDAAKRAGKGVWDLWGKTVPGLGGR